MTERDCDYCENEIIADDLEEAECSECGGYYCDRCLDPEEHECS